MNTKEENLIPEHRLTIAEKNAVQAKHGPFGVWCHEATRRTDKAHLFTKVTYNHSTRGTWKGLLLHENGTVEPLFRLPPLRLNSKKWALTSYGYDVVKGGRE